MYVLCIYNAPNAQNYIHMCNIDVVAEAPTTAV